MCDKSTEWSENIGSGENSEGYCRNRPSFTVLTRRQKARVQFRSDDSRTRRGQETKLLQYADDTTATLSDLNSARAFFDLLDTFKLLSGLTINYSKTEGMWIGSCRNNNFKPFGIIWPREPIKALGVYYSYDLTFFEKKTSLRIWTRLKNS